MKIRTRPGIRRRSRRPDPPDWAAARIVLRNAWLGAVAMAQTGDFITAHLRPRQVGDIEIEDGIGRQRIGAQTLHDRQCSTRGGLEMTTITLAHSQRHRYRGHAEEDRKSTRL